jgi:hypothetical protein
MRSRIWGFMVFERIEYGSNLVDVLARPIRMKDNHRFLRRKIDEIHEPAVFLLKTHEGSREMPNAIVPRGAVDISHLALFSLQDAFVQERLRGLHEPFANIGNVTPIYDAKIHNDGTSRIAGNMDKKENLFARLPPPTSWKAYIAQICDG